MIPDQREVTLREEPTANETALTDLDTLLFEVPEVMRDE